MSLLLHRRAIARAVVGDLAAADEDRLHAHLRGCAACRAFYDELSLAAQALATRSEATRRDARERTRLAGALAAPAVAAPAARSRRRWVGVRLRVGVGAVGLVLAPAAALLLWLGRAPDADRGPADGTRPHAPEISWRGGSPDDAGTGPALIVYASRRSGTGAGTRAPLRLVGELPGSGVLRVSRADFIQFGARGLADAATSVSIVARDEAGAAQVFLPRAGTAPPPVPAGPTPSVVGPSFDLSHGPAAGRYTLTARFTAARRPGDAGRDTPALDASPIEVSGLLIVEP